MKDAPSLPPLPSERELPRPTPTLMQTIIRLTAEAAGVTSEELIGYNREASLTWPRHLAMTTCRRHTGASLAQIGRVFRRDHSTIVHACKRVADRETPAVLDFMAEIARLAQEACERN